MTANLPADVATVIVADCLEVLNADAGYVGTVGTDGQTIEVARVTEFSHTPVRLEFPLDAPYPLAETIRTGRELFIESNEQLVCDHPGLVRVKEEDHACATLPLYDENGDLLGALNLGFDEPHEFTPDEREQIQILAGFCADVMARTRRLGAELDRVARA